MPRRDSAVWRSCVLFVTKKVEDFDRKKDFDDVIMKDLTNFQKTYSRNGNI